MKKINVFILAFTFLTICNQATGQTYFQKTYGSISDDYGNHVTLLKDNNFAIVGYNNDGICFIKVDSLGIQLWQKSFNPSDMLNFNYCYSFQETQDSGFIIAGNIGYTSGNGGDICLIKTNSSGGTLWTKILAGPNPPYYRAQAYEIINTYDGGFAITGNEEGSFSKDVFLIKTDGNGNVQWSKSYGGSNDDEGYSLKQTVDGGFVIAGYTSSFGNGSRDVYFLKVNSNGNLLWTKTFGGIFWDFANHVEVTDDKGFVLTGISSNNVTGFNMFIMKTDSSGNSIWANTYGGNENDIGTSVKQTSDGSYIATGYTNSFGAGQEDVYLVKTDSNGNALWSKTYGGASTEQGNDVIEVARGFVITGETRNFSRGLKDVYLIKIDSSGNGTCNQDTAQTISTNLNWIHGSGGIETTSGNTNKVYSIIILNQDTASYNPCICIPPVANYHNSETDGCVQFYDYSTWANTWFWDFGDGDTSTLQNSNHCFVNGTFYVCLTVSNDCGTKTYCDSLGIYGNGINKIEKDKTEIFIVPNPFNDFTTLKFENKKNEKLNLIIISPIGQIVMKIENITDNEIQIERNNLTRGLYFLQLRNNKNVVATVKLVIE